MNVEELRNKGGGEARFIALIESLCNAAIDVRSKITCCLSAEDNEWSFGEGLVSATKDYKRLMRLAKEYADSVCDEPENLVWELMAIAARNANQSPILPW